MTSTPDIPNTNDNLGNSLPTIDSQICHADQLTYWSSQTADVNGMLGGYPQVSRIDLQGSRNFITKIRRLSRQKLSASNSTQSSRDPYSSGKDSASSSHDTNSKRVKLAVDCGAGIGRITSGLLLNIAESVDIVEPIAKFTDVLRNIQPGPDQGKVCDIFNCGLETWQPPEGKQYDLIWIQWCLGHLTDKQAVEFLRRASQSLADESEQRQEGWIMVKENLSTDVFGEDIFDEVDSSVTRSDQKFTFLFEEAGLKIVRMETQSGFPKGLYPVKMYALRPK